MRLVPRRLAACMAVLVLGLLSPGIGHAADDGGRARDVGGPVSALSGASSRSCRHGDRGRLLRFERVASHPTAADARAYLDSWIEFYRDFYQFPADLAFDIRHGFDTYKVT